jgi:hypothetical protein
MTMVGGRIVHGAGPFVGLAPAAIPVAPEWLPIGSYPSYHAAEVMDGGVALAAATLAAHGPVPMVGERGPWSLGCLCGLL